MNSSHGNTIGDDEKKKIWIPNLVFDNSIKDDFIKNDQLSFLKIKRQV